MTSPPNMGLPIYAKNCCSNHDRPVTPTPRHMSAQIARNLYIDDEVVQCDDLNDLAKLVYEHLDSCQYHPLYG